MCVGRVAGLLESPQFVSLLSRSICYSLGLEGIKELVQEEHHKSLRLRISNQWRQRRTYGEQAPYHDNSAKIKHFICL